MSERSRRVRRRACAGMLICWLAASAAPAQHPLVLKKLNDLDAASPAPTQATFADEIAKAAHTLYPDKPGCAKRGLVVERISPATAERYVFSGAVGGRLRNGWTAVVRHPDCDKAPVRYMIVQDAGGALRTIRVNRGTSYAHDSLIADTLPLAVLAAEAFLTRSKVACAGPKKAQLGIVRVESDGSGLGPDVKGVRYAGSWTEIWPLSVCGRIVEVPVIFTADGDGGAYTDIKGASLRQVATPSNRSGSR